MSFQPIRNAIKAKLLDVDSIQQVIDFPSNTFTGYPAAMVTTSRSEAEFNTTQEDERIYVFTIYIMQEVAVLKEQKSRRVIEGVVDDVLDAFDNDQLLDGVDLPSNETIIISLPALSQIYNSDDTKYIVGEMEIKVKTQFKIS